MDDKIHMSAILGDAKCAPIAYTSVEDIEEDCPDNQLFFVKRGSTSARGVYIHSYAELKSGSVDTTACIIHRNILNPKLIMESDINLGYMDWLLTGVYMFQEVLG